MKRKILLTLLTMTSAALTLTGCGEPEHVHTWATTWSRNENQHWVIATCHPEVCSYLGDHSDGNNDGYCDACGYKMSGENPDPGHIHTYEAAWSTNSTQHWHAATCGHDVKSELGNHIDSNNDNYCDTCNYQISEPDPSDYYSSITNDLTGTNLLSALQSLNKSKRRRTVSYAGMKTFAPICDANPDKPNRMVGFYNNKDLPNYWDDQETWNREHVWPKSLGGNQVEGDAFMPRPCDVDINGGRGNKVYSKTAYDPGCEGYANYRGICARIIFYCVVASPSLRILDNNSGDGSSMGKLSDLLEWNLAYMPSKSETAALELRVEQNRNNVIQTHPSGQGNRNPFIDHPEYACKIWGTTNSETRRICGM
ncbi:MAG: endonuclease [Bacteroidales bacterium]|nr:endonuclease [Bacteroidales bacterium]